jgi:hypothetical protein
MVIHRLATYQHYQRHIDPIWAALPDDMRGEVIGYRRPYLWRIPKHDIVLIAGAVDIDYEWGCPQVYVEHGSGQSYVDARAKSRPYYPGGPHPPNVIGYISPNERVAASWGRPAVAVGCPPLDDLAQDAPGIALRRTVAMMFHWDAGQVCPEAGTALEHYIDDLPMIVHWATDHGCEFIGHAHPRDVNAPGMWDRLGVEYVDDIDEVLQRASCVIADNSSVLTEAMALDIPVVFMNAPWYRRDVHHGGRFWDWPRGGVMVDNADQLVRLNPSSLASDTAMSRRREEVVAEVYSVPVGGGGARLAAGWLLEMASSLR